jgi:hypothetical protein
MSTTHINSKEANIDANTELGQEELPHQHNHGWDLVFNGVKPLQFGVRNKWIPQSDIS